MLTQIAMDNAAARYKLASTSQVLVLLLFILIALPSTSAGDEVVNSNSSRSKILVWPAEFSHWINLKILASELVSRGNDVTILRSSAYHDFMEETDEFKFENFNVTGFGPGDHLQSMDKVLHLLKLGERKSSMFQTVIGMVQFWLQQLEMRERQCNAIMTNEVILSRLLASNFNVVLADPSVPCGEIIAAKLGVPLIYVVRVLPAEVQFQFSQTPLPISYVPMINTEFTDRMSFPQRLANALTYVYQTVGFEVYSKVFMDPMVQKYLGQGTGYKEMMSRASLWLIRTDFAFEYPRPMMPNVKFIGGFHCKPAKPLQQDLEEFVGASGDDGFIVFSMGSMVRSMHKSKANLIAAAFAKLKQKVVWRYLGDRPDTLAANTRIMPWLPQNDLLGHPKCKLFVTHGGTNGIYEAIYHGIPMLGLPLLVDQFDNMVRITGRGAGKSLDITGLDEEEFRLTIETLIYNSSYRESASILSARHRDREISPLDSATFWIEYVIRHKGAAHLRPAAHELLWFQYHLLDVVLFLIAIILGIGWITHKLFRILIRRRPLDKTDKNNGDLSQNRSDLVKSAVNGSNGITNGNGLVYRNKNGASQMGDYNDNVCTTNGFKKHPACEYCSNVHHS